MSVPVESTLVADLDPPEVVMLTSRFGEWLNESFEERQSMDRETRVLLEACKEVLALPARSAVARVGGPDGIGILLHGAFPCREGGASVRDTDRWGVSRGETEPPSMAQVRRAVVDRLEGRGGFPSLDGLLERFPALRVWLDERDPWGAWGGARVCVHLNVFVPLAYCREVLTDAREAVRTPLIVAARAFLEWEAKPESGLWENMPEIMVRRIVSALPGMPSYELRGEELRMVVDILSRSDRPEAGRLRSRLLARMGEAG